MNGRRPDETWAHELLSHVSADCPREQWWRVGAALRAGLGSAGWLLFREWSQSAPDRYDADDCRRTWDSLTADGDVTFGTLVHMARGGGWRSRPDTVQTQQWTIREPDGTAVAIHYRMDRPDGDKRLWWGRPDGNIGLGGRKTRELPLYGIELLSNTTATEIVIVEGERAADALRNAEPTVLALGTVTGAAARPIATVLQPVAKAGKPVYLWPDADPDGAGRRHMERVAQRLIEAGASAPAIIQWPGAPSHGDAADWTAVGKQPALATLMSDAVVFTPKRAGRPKKPRPQPGAGTPARPVIVIEKGGALKWWRKAVRALVAAGPRDDLKSLYASPVTAAATGELTGGIVLLRRQPLPTRAALNAARWSSEDEEQSRYDRIRFPTDELVIDTATPQAVKNKLVEHAEWWQRPFQGEARPTDPTDTHAKDVVERYRQDCLSTEFPRFRLLNGIVDSPTLRGDGTLLDTPGYDAQSGLFCDFEGSGWQIPTKPTRADARDAMRLLHDVVSETLFASNVHRSVWVAGLLTVVGREYARGNVPLFAVSANHRGAGKGTLVDLASAIAIGRPATKWSPPAGRRSDSEVEEDKRLTTVALNGTRIMLYDNVRAGEPIGMPALDRSLTAGADGSMGEISGRVLSKNVEARAPWRVVVWVTGNNLTTRSDMDRRVLLCRLHTDMENPQDRPFKRRSPVDYALDRRRELLTACLTILLAHKQAIDNGDPGAVLDPWGSFVYWSNRIRSAVAWADPEGCDPHHTTLEVQEQAHPEQAETETLLAAWHAEFSSREVQARDLENLCQEGAEEYNAALADAVAGIGLAPPRGKAAFNTRSMGVWLTAHAERPGPYVLHKGAQRKWFVLKRPPNVGRQRAYEIDLSFPLGNELYGTDSDRWLFVEVDVTREPDERKALLTHGNLTVGALDNGALLVVYNPVRNEDDGTISEAITKDSRDKVTSHLMYGVIRTVRAADTRVLADVTLPRPEPAVSLDQYGKAVLKVLQEMNPERYQRVQSGDLSEWVSECVMRVVKRFEYPAGACLPMIEDAAREVIAKEIESE